MSRSRRQSGLTPLLIALRHAAFYRTPVSEIFAGLANIVEFDVPRSAVPISV
jgi:hypothetical protein